jgi:putative oxidoreductase
MAIGLLILRVVVGALFVGHGVQKLFGWFGGPGLEGATGFMRSLGYRNARVAAVAAGLTETASGLLLASGFITPLAVAGVIGVMVNAAATVHRHNGLWNANGGFELPLVYTVIAASLAFHRSGCLLLGPSPRSAPGRRRIRGRCGCPGTGRGHGRACDAHVREPA